MNPYQTLSPSLNQYLNSTSQTLLTATEEKQLAKQYQDYHSNHAKQLLIEHNIRLVVYIAKCYRNQRDNTLTFSDLIQEGNLGLIEGIEHYDYHNGARISTYVSWWIHQSIRQGIANYGRIIRIPVYLYTKRNKLVKVSNQLRNDLNREPLDSELAAEMNLSIKKLTALKGAINPIESLNYHVKAPNSGDDETELQDIIADETTSGQNIIHHIDVKDLHHTLDQMLAPLKLIDKIVLKARYGYLNDGKILTLDQTAKLLYGMHLTKHQVTRERIHQYQTHALKSIHSHHNLKILADYLN